MIISIEDTEQFYSRIIQTLKSGGVVAIPTDTVYGLAVDGANPQARKSLDQLKNRDRKPYTLFMPKSAIDKYAIVVKKKVIDYFVPGPLTVILKTRPETEMIGGEKKIGIRIPQTGFVLKLLNTYQQPLAVTSANVSGERTLSDAALIAAAFPQIELVVDGGQLTGEASTVVDLTTTPLTVLRKGKIPILEIEKIYGRRVRLAPELKVNVLFVCTGNSCRSPMAEAIFSTLIDPRHAEARSAGSNTTGGQPASEHAQRIAQEFRGTLAQHRSRELSVELVRWADMILVMQYKHYQSVIEFAPEAVAKTFLLKEYKHRSRYNEVADPIGKDLAAYRDTALDMYPSLKIVARDIEKRYGK